MSVNFTFYIHIFFGFNTYTREGNKDVYSQLQHGFGNISTVKIINVRSLRQNGHSCALGHSMREDRPIH